MRVTARYVLPWSLLFAACQPDSGTAPSRLTLSDAASPSVTVSTCDGCIFGPALYTKDSNQDVPETSAFTTTSRMAYRLDIDDLGSKGADESVTVNGLTFQRARLAGETGPRSNHFLIAGLPVNSSIVVTQLGKKKSQVLVSLRKALGIVSVVPASTTLTIGAGWIDYTATFVSYAINTNFSDLGIQGWIEQGIARRAAGGSIVLCGLNPGEMAPGDCAMPFLASANNTTSDGTGTLVPGAATLVVELKHSTSGGEVVYDEERVAITLVNP